MAGLDKGIFASESAIIIVNPLSPSSIRLKKVGNIPGKESAENLLDIL